MRRLLTAAFGVALGCSSGTVVSSSKPIPIEGSPVPEAEPAPPDPGPRVEIKNDHPQVVERVRFEPGSSRVPDDASDLLAEIANVMVENPQILVVAVVGHSDASEAVSAVAIDIQRAEAVRDALVRLGVERERLVIEGKGSESPLSENSTPEGRAQNPRVEFEIRRQDR